MSTTTRLRVPAYSGHYVDNSPEAEHRAFLAEIAHEVAQDRSNNPLSLDVDFLESDGYSESSISSIEEDEELNMEADEEIYAHDSAARRQNSSNDAEYAVMFFGTSSRKD